MKLFTILALLIAIATVIFSLQNSAPILISFFGWKLQESMALVLLLTFSSGVLFGFLISLPTAIKRMRKIAQLKKQVEEQAYHIENLDQKFAQSRTNYELPVNNTVLQPESQPPRDFL